MMELKFVKLICVRQTLQLPDGSLVNAQRYMDIDGNIIAETIDGSPYPSAVREIEKKIRKKVAESEQQVKK